MHRAFVDPSFIDAVVRGETNQVPKSAATRLLKVVRVKKDEEVGLFDGCGREVRGVIDEHAVLAHARVLEQSLVAPGIYLIQAVSEEKKLQETIARGAEFGIDGFLIFAAKRSTPYSFDKAVKNYPMEKINEIRLLPAKEFPAPPVHLTFEQTFCNLCVQGNLRCDYYPPDLLSSHFPVCKNRRNTFDISI